MKHIITCFLFFAISSLPAFSQTTGKDVEMALLKAKPVDSQKNITNVNLVNKEYFINPDTLVKETPLALVQRQLNGFNRINLDAFLEPYDDSVELYKFPCYLLGEGKEFMRDRFSGMFKFRDLHCEIKHRIIQDNLIIDEESITGGGTPKVGGVAIYEIENNKIKRVYYFPFLPGL